MAQREGEILRRELDRVGARRGPCFSEDLKERATAWIIKRRAEGMIVAAIASELGLAAGTVLKWSARSKSARALVPIEVVADREFGAHGERRFAVRLSRRRIVAARGRGALAGTRMILGTSRAVRVFANPEPVDLRKGYDGLYDRTA